MAVTLPLSKMSRSDKLRAMEALWVGLSRDESSVESPDWHATELKKAERLVKAGKAKFSNWETAKARIRLSLSKSTA